jgi:hypothetical protein
VLAVALTSEGITLRLAWWTNKLGHPEVLHLQDRVLTTLKKQLTAHEVAFPTQSQQIFLQPFPEKRQESVPNGFAVTVDEAV